MTINDHIENAFDLSYTEFPKCPKTEIKSIGIIGGGTAGYLAALALNKYHPQIKTSVVESRKIPVIGVGESTTSEIVSFLHHGLGIDPIDFFNGVKPTLKFGIRFDWGAPNEDKFNFSFFAGHQYESYYYENHIKHSNWISCLMNENKIPILRQKDGSLTSFLGSVPFSYHIDNKSLILFLRNTLQQRNIENIDAEVTEVVLDENGFVDHLETKEGLKPKFDLYIDCTGFRSKILGQAMKTEFIPFTSTLVTDRALTFDKPNNKVINCFTGVDTMNNGWCWTIPMRGENHHGYVHSSKFCDEKTALAEASAKYGPIENYKMVEFRSGRHKVAWTKNVFSLGNAYAFVEPLESTGIQTAVHSMTVLCRLMPNSMNDHSSIAALNQEIAATWDTFRWFLGIHYRFNRKLDTPFWKWSQENTDIGDAKYILDHFNERPPLSASNFGSGSPYTAFEPMVFNSYSYDTLLFGQKLLKKPLAKPQMSKEEYFSKVESYKELTKHSLTLYELFNDPRISEEELVTQLFEDPDTWILEGDV